MSDSTQVVSTERPRGIRAGELRRRLVPTLYEDERLLAVAKPYGIDAGGRDDRAAGSGKRAGAGADRGGGSSPTGLVELIERLGGYSGLQPINRLARFESGVLLLGKDPEIVEFVRTGLRNERVVQEYAAVVLGRMRDPRVIIKPPPSTTPGRAKRGRPKGKERKEVGESGPATTVTRQVQGESRALVRCRTNVRTTHMLRAQLRAARLRLLGDSVRDRTGRPKRPELTCLHLSRLAFHHPDKKTKVTVTARAPEVFKSVAEGEREFERAVHAALVRRLPCLAEDDTDCFRLITGAPEHVHGLVAEALGPVVIMQVFDEQPPLRNALRGNARWYREVLGIESVYVKRFPKRRLDADEALIETLHSPKPFVGRPVPEEITVVERGLKFAVRPHEGFSTGLFLNHRDVRTKVREMAAGKTVLNLFAYTCSFSVAAAAGGAERTVNVDLSRKHLDWGRINFELNGLDAASQAFHVLDIADYFKQARREGEAFDIVVVDPPTFAHGRKGKRDFSLMRDLPGLIRESIELLRPEGVLVVSTSYRRIPLKGLRELVKAGAGERRFRVTDTPGLPLDFAPDPDHAKTLVVQFR